MKPEDCPKFERCNAPICPLDPDWRQRTHLPGEAVCLFLREAAKNGGVLPAGDSATEEQRKQVTSVYPEVIQAYGAVRRALERAAKTGSKMTRKPGPVTEGL